MPILTDHSEDPDCRRIALLAMLMVAAYEGEIVPATECEVDPEAAATVWLLAQAGVTLADV